MTKLDLKIISGFSPIDRLEEIVHTYEKIPRLENRDIDYWQCAKLLCEKDGGKLPTPEELQQIAEYIYGQKVDLKGWTDVDISAKKLLKFMNDHNLKNYGSDDAPWFGLWSSTEADAYGAGGRYFDTTDTIYSDGGSRGYDNIQVLCLGDV